MSFCLPKLSFQNETVFMKTHRPTLKKYLHPLITIFDQNIANYKSFVKIMFKILLNYLSVLKNEDVNNLRYFKHGNHSK